MKFLIFGIDGIKIKIYKELFMSERILNLKNLIKKYKIKNTIQLENFMLKYKRFIIDIDFLRKLIKFNIKKMKKLYNL